MGGGAHDPLRCGGCGVANRGPGRRGIRDFVDRSWLVEDFEDVATFSRKLTELATSTELRAQLRRSQYMSLARDRSWIAFTSSLHGIKNYMGVA